jgi:GWxTD domain-containing protein
MTFRRVLVAALLLSGTARAAGLERYEGWGRSPEFVFLSMESEQKEWKKVASDSDAERFVQLFWARRNPDLKTADNEFKTVFDARVKEADELFPIQRLRGALTERGKLYIVLGPPKTLRRSVGTRPQPGVREPPNPPGTTLGEQIAVFIYDADHLPGWAEIKSLVATFVVEESLDFVVDGSPGFVAGGSWNLGGRSTAGVVQRLEVTARTNSIRNPDLKEPPSQRTPAEQVIAAPATADAFAGPPLAPQLRAALEALLDKKDSGLLAALPIANRAGNASLHLQLFVPTISGPIPAGTHLAVLVRDKDGREAVRHDAIAEVQTAPGGSFVSQAFAIREGDFAVAAGLFDGSGKVLVAARRSVSVRPTPTDLTLGPVVVASTIVPVQGARASDGFTFSGHRFFTKAGRLDATDGLSFLVRVYNPAMDPSSRTVRIARTVKIKPPGEPAVEVPQPADQPIPVPKLDDKEKPGMLTVDLAANLIETDLGQYFRRPGDYILQVFITDVVSKKTAEASATFTISGTLAPKR